MSETVYNQFFNLNNDLLFSQSILDVFVLQDILYQDDAETLKKKFKTNREVEDFLIKNRIVTKDTINKAYSIILKLPYIDLKNVGIPDEIRKIISEKSVRRFGVIPFGMDEGLLRVAVANPTELFTNFKQIIQNIFDNKDVELELFITGESDLFEVLKQYSNKKNQLLIKKASLPVVYLRNQSLDKNYLDKFPVDFIEKYRIVVFGQNKKGYYLVACETPDSPITVKILDFVKKENNIKVEPFATSRDDIEFILDKLKGKTSSQNVRDSGENYSNQNANTVKETSSRQSILEQKRKNESGQKGASASTKTTLNALIRNIIPTTNSPELTIDTIEENDQIEDIGSDQNQISVSVEKDNVVNEKKDSTEEKKDSDSADNENNLEQSTNTVLNVPQNDQQENDKTSTEILETKNIGSLLDEEVVTKKALEEIAKQNSIPKIVAAVVNYALNNRSSDVHIEPEQKSLRVRCRIDGILNDVLRLPINLHPPFVSRIKIMSKLKIDESRVPQDGRFDVVFKNKEVDVRVSTLPTVHGEKVVMRVLDKSQGILSLEDLGMQGSAFEETINAMKKPFGIILSTGPTGSGKSTTLYAVLNRISVPGVNIVTLEDPVEYEISGVNQCQIKPEIGFTFASGLRSILRQDPNVIMVGEIRDAETAAMSTHAALTGHLVLSTLHTNDTAGALPRLINMGVEPFLITSSINLVIAQRLIRRICPHCKEEMKVPAKLMDQLKEEINKISPNNVKDRERFPNEFKLFYGKGCSECNHGYKGRVGIFEVMTITPDIEDLAVAKSPANEIRDLAIKDGMITMKQDGILKAFQGLTTIDEVFQAVINN